VRNLQEALAAYVRQKMDEKNLSTYEVERRSGGDITHGSVWNILNQRVADVKAGTLRALAKGLGVSEDEIFAVARGKLLNGAEAFDSELAAMFRGLAELSDEDKAELLSTVRMLAAEVQRRTQKLPRSKVTKNGPQLGRVYDAVAGIPKSVKSMKKKQPKTSSKKNT
jgi:transcriptional regulator with XRE-family HTH domain